MADHVRTQLRDAVTSALAGLATTGANVFPSRVRPLEAGAIPGLLVFCGSEESEDVTVSAPVTRQRNIEVRIEGYAVANADLEATLDQIAKEVEVEMDAGVVVGSKTILFRYEGCDMEIDDDGEQPTGSITLRYSSKVFTTAGAPDVFN